ncbi:tetratricopeptide repeat protein [Stratiformator vulcanicus]|uniref:Lipoprotein NlpI n=1 Tax=Stratiformator vulcanicus TaxID=2527980 RepID=A0A517QYT1_9PLAN|nr:hypothetical protein [Stratiformator vulcanicus]QDT36791.1 lipoprotein NlpI [Stratiformator vulcanicus]
MSLRSRLLFLLPVSLCLSCDDGSISQPEAASTEAARVQEPIDEREPAAELPESISPEPAPESAADFYASAVEHFVDGQFKQSVADFDRYVELNPGAERRLWERGISQYYAGMYDAGAKQFALYQSYDDNDVENAVWRFLCMARDPDVGIEKARAELLPIENDTRIPMMQVYELFRGNATSEDVIAAAREGDPNPTTLAGRMFYADLYLGIYAEATGDTEAAKKHIRAAAAADPSQLPISGYMHDVAVVHERLFEEKK